MLYNEFRPSVFDDVVGQENNVTILKRQVMSDNVSNSILLYGHHGTGKTTIARILARAVNCEQLKDGNPCGCCPSCKLMMAGTPDFIEIDAASNNSVENVREILQSAQYVPAVLKYKVFIIDEVHMLSTAAFNALLKTLEEPPQYTKFFLCTTDFYKIPATIRSRCQRFLFRALTKTEIADRLFYVLDKKGIKMEEDAVYMIAEGGEGALRDALSILEQCITTGSTTLEAVQALVGILPEQYFFDIIHAFSSGNLHLILTTFQGLSAEQLSNKVITDRIMEIIIDRMTFLCVGTSAFSGYTKDYIRKIENVEASYQDCLSLQEQLGKNYANIKLAFITTMVQSKMIKEHIGIEEHKSVDAISPVTDSTIISMHPEANAVYGQVEKGDALEYDEECPFDDEPEEDFCREKPSEIKDPFSGFDMGFSF